jgi:putative copper resistance protein D
VRELYLLNVTVHVLAAMLWLGGMFFLALAGGPVLRRIDDRALRARLFEDLGEAFRRAGWWSILVLVLTGIGNLGFRGLLSRGTLMSGAFWASPFGHSLAAKLVAVVAMIVISALHDFVVGPAASRAARGGGAEAERLRGRAARLARLNAMLGLVVVVLAVRLARGG